MKQRDSEAGEQRSKEIVKQRKLSKKEVCGWEFCLKGDVLFLLTV